MAGRDANRPFEHKKEILERLRQGPGCEAQQDASPTPRGPPPSRWTLRTIRAMFECVRQYTLPGVWQWLRRRVGVKLRSAEVQQYSPDPDYAKKERRLKRCLTHAGKEPDWIVAVFLDEMGYSVWPDPARDWAGAPPAPRPFADRQRSNNGLWRIVGAMNALTGRVTYVDDYIVGRKKLMEMYRCLRKSYPNAERIYVIQDNWSIHSHPDVLEALRDLPQITPVWLPTYAPWLNPIEKLWRWLREYVLKMHRLADDAVTLRARVNGFLDQFARRSTKLLHYVGLLGDGKLAQWLHPQ